MAPFIGGFTVENHVDKTLGSDINSDQQLRYALAHRMLPLVAVGGFLLGGMFGILGIILVYLGAKGNTDIRMFGASISTGSVGAASLFIAAMTVILISLRVLKELHSLLQIRKS